MPRPLLEQGPTTLNFNHVAAFSFVSKGPVVRFYTFHIGRVLKYPWTGTTASGNLHFGLNDMHLLRNWLKKELIMKRRSLTHLETKSFDGAALL